MVRAAALIAGIALASCGQNDTAYTLYRTSVVTPAARLHIATFDAREDASYNHENCETARSLFQDQPGVKVTFWCEKGTYRA